VQALYQWQIAHTELAELESYFLTEFNFKKTDVDYFRDLIKGVITHTDQIDEKFLPFLDRALSALGPVELAILRMSAYELLYRPDIPYKVILNESINLTKIFGATDAHKYINGVLDKLARQERIDAK
jgi:N utilization substance protein B